ncbi:MAG: FAD-dependent oxidoreductase [Rhodoferax sp.]|nr:FAD-dependent oxidoreductase [Rhodoferax sp.]
MQITEPVPPLAQAAALLRASDLPAAWAGRTAWTILDTHFGAGERFLATWQAWRADPQRPRMLHYVGHISAQDYGHHFHTPPAPDAQDHYALYRACADRSEGVHRLLLDSGQVSLTLCIGDSKALFADHRLLAHTLWVETEPPQWDRWTARALARLCMRGATLLAQLPADAEPAWLREAGFVDLGTAANGAWRCTFNPAWPLGSKEPPCPEPAGAPALHCCVIGAGISGASVAYAMARRGWRVTVLDRAAHAAAGASGLPAGLVVPHVSADDSPRSRLSRVGSRLMLQHAAALLAHGTEWALSGVHEHRFNDGPDRLHRYAGWIRPAALVQAWLRHARITTRYGTAVQGFARDGSSWSVFQGPARSALTADVVVLANAYGARELLCAHDLQAHRTPTLPLTLADLQAVHGTASVGTLAADSPLMPAGMAHNGHGCFITVGGERDAGFWLAGSTFEPDPQPTAATWTSHRLAPLGVQHAENLARLQALVPAAAHAVAAQFDGAGPHSWSGTRCVTHDRLPLCGPVDAQGANGLWMHVGMGARGLTFSALGAELLAARIHAEPWPVETTLARSIDSQRLRKRRAKREPESDST